MKDVSEPLASDSLDAVDEGAATLNPEQQLWLDAVVDGKLSMSYFSIRGYAKLFVRPVPQPCDEVKVAFYSVNLLGDQILLEDSADTYPNTGRTVPIFKNRFERWWSQSQGEGSRSVRWRLQLDGYSAGVLVRTYYEYISVTR